MHRRPRKKQDAETGTPDAGTAGASTGTLLASEPLRSHASVRRVSLKMALRHIGCVAALLQLLPARSVFIEFAFDNYQYD